MKKIIILIITVSAFCLSAKAQIVSSHYYDNYGSPFLRFDVMKSSYSYSGDDSISFFPEDSGYHGIGGNVTIGYYVPIWKTSFFYAPEIGLTIRGGKEKLYDDFFSSYIGVGLRAVPLQFGYSFDLSNSVTVNPRIGAAASYIPLGSITYKTKGSSESSESQSSKTTRKWDEDFDSFETSLLIGCDLVFRDSNFILSLVAESGPFIQAGISLGFLF